MRLQTLHYIDDSPDEFLITRLLFRRSKIDVELMTHSDFADFMRTVEADEDFEPAKTLVISDLNLAVTSGLDGVRALRNNPDMANIVVGICSGSDDPADCKEAMQAQADFFVTKPLNKEALAKICKDVDSLLFVERDDGTCHLMLSGQSSAGAAS